MSDNNRSDPAEYRAVRGNTIKPEKVESESVHTDQAPGIADYVIKAGDDAKSVINSAPQNSHIAVEPGATYDIAPPLQPAEGVTIDSGISAWDNYGATFRKVGDGNMMDVPSDLTMRGIRFEGNKANYSGDGLVHVDGRNNNNHYYTNVKIVDMAGDGIVHKRTGFNRYEDIAIKDCDGWGMRNTLEVGESFGGGVRRSFLKFRITNCGSGGMKIEASDRQNRYEPRIGGCSGPGIMVDHSLDNSSSTRFWTIGPGQISGNDGPAIYGDEAEVYQGHLRDINIYGNGESATLPSETPVGSVIHVDTDTDNWQMSTEGGGWGGNSPIINYQGGTLKLTVDDTETSGADDITGAVNLSVADSSKWAASGGSSGYRFNPGFDRFESVSDGYNWYYDVKNSPPSSPNPGDSYLDNGGNTLSGQWRRRLFFAGNWYSIGSEEIIGRSSDPGTDELTSGQGYLYISDGSSGVTGADGDLIYAINDGGTIKTLNIGSPTA